MNDLRGRCRLAVVGTLPTDAVARDRDCAVQFVELIAVNTNLAAVAGAATAMLIWYFAFGRPDISMACNGLLAGLVAITAPCAFVGSNAAVIIGALAGALVCGGVLFNERTLKVDDPCGAI